MQPMNKGRQNLQRLVEESAEHSQFLREEMTTELFGPHYEKLIA